MHPLYLDKDNRSKLKEKIKILREILSACVLCPRRCQVNRLKGELGFCRAGKEAVVSSAFAHFGEESCLVGEHGSGTIFFSHCNLRCIFCQNYQISHLEEGEPVTPEELADYMLRLKALGCHNINLVTPTHFVPQILEALEIAIEKGLNLPLVYNCGGYESEAMIDLLEGVIDIYMPDVKFSSSEVSKRFCNTSDYFENLKKVLKKMHQQVGDLLIIDGIAQRGLLIRHLVMPEGLADTEEIMGFIAKEISKDTYINIMGQYRPCGYAYKFPSINRWITAQEYQMAIEIARSFGLYRFD
ncbi:MAG: radical SAM protein [Candidatus Omnitrophica bacterium]|nr:radical SAM protein [Candidatus Omnitrophota bacterium]